MYICIDLGGTNVRGTWVDRAGQYGQLFLLPRPTSLQGTKDCLQDLIERIQDQICTKVQGIGLASAGPLDHRKRLYLETTNMPELNYFHIGDFLEEVFDLPVIMENDAQAAALGEVWQGSLAGSQQAVVLTLGTGVGSGVISKGRIWRGGHFTGPELGHIFLGPGMKKRCGCDQVGCAETWLQKEALKEIFRFQGLKIKTLRDLQPLIEGHDHLARRGLEIYGRRLGLYLSVLQVIFGFEDICLSGGLSWFVPYCREHIWSTLHYRLQSRNWLLPQRIVASTNPEMSALWGMARAWINAEKDD